jgi:small-conductance mechanosensitive channel
MRKEVRHVSALSSSFIILLAGVGILGLGLAFAFQNIAANFQAFFYHFY